MNRLAAEDEPPGGTNAVILSLAVLNNFGVFVMRSWFVLCLIVNLDDYDI